MQFSIKHKIYGSFLLFALIFVVNGLIIIATLNYSNKLSRHFTEVANPSIHSLYDFRKLLLQSQMYSTNWVFLRSSADDKAALTNIHEKVYPALKARLSFLAEQWYNVQMRDSLKTLFARIEDLQVHEKFIMNSLVNFEDYDDPLKKFGAEELLENEILPDTKKSFDLLEKIVSQEKKVVKEEERKIENYASFMRIMILSLSVLLIIAVVIFSKYMAKSIIQPIHRIIGIVNDLGKGKINKVELNTNGDEIGEMVRSINNLSQKIALTAAFANDIGNRNFNSIYEPLSKEDILGKALIAMRHNLLSSEKKLNSANIERETLFRNIEEVFFSIGFPDFEFIQMSPACEKVYGYAIEDFQENPMLWYEIVVEEDLKIINDNNEKMLTGKSFIQEYRIHHKDNSIRWVETKITPTLDDAGQLIRIDGVTADVSKRKEADETLKANHAELKKTNAELDKFVYSISHDLRAPLASILGVINLTEAKSKEELTIKHLGMLKKSVNKLDDFISDIMDYSRNERMEIKHDEIDFKELLNDVSANLKFMSVVREVKIDVNINGDVKLKSDKNRLEVILNNIISNAIRYQNPNTDSPFVKVEIATTENNALIKIIDNGIGISNEYKEKVFDMFYRVSDASVGSGLGLYIVKETMAKLQGQITLESEPGKGTVFTLHIPNYKMAS